MCTQCLFISFAVQSGIGIADSRGQLGCSLHSGSAPLRRRGPLRNSKICCPPAAFKLLDVADQELPKAARQHELCAHVAPVTNAGHRDLTLKLPCTLLSVALGFPSYAECDIADWCPVNFLVLFSMILCSMRGLRAARCQVGDGCHLHCGMIGCVFKVLGIFCQITLHRDKTDFYSPSHQF